MASNNDSLKGRIDRILARVMKPARYVGGELNSIAKNLDGVSVRVALAFPDTYEVGMSNLGLRILYHAVNVHSEYAAERVYAPAVDMESEMRAEGVPLFSLETFTPIGDFDIVGFSLAYELSYTTVLNMLDLAGIPIRSADRGDSDPVIIAGGHCAFNPEPMSDFIDAFAIGDGEEVLLDILEARKRTGRSRAATLDAFAQIDGVYVPSVHNNLPQKPVIHSRIVADLDKSPFPDSLIVPFTDVVHDRVTLEIMRGCSRGCRFCQAGMITRPVRERSMATVFSQAEKLIDRTGYDEVALTSLSSADYTKIGDLVTALITAHGANGVGVSLPSLRADAACVQLADEIQKVRKSGLTFAPEAGTQRMRDVINKGVTEDDLLSAVEAAVECGWRRVKLYFMIGLPGETDEDLLGIPDLVRKVAAIGRAHRVPLAVGVTISPFVPKPHTPFQWRAMNSPEELQRKIGILQPQVHGKNITMSWHEPTSTRVEAALARGDSRICDAVFDVWQHGGKFEQDRFDYSRWEAAFERAGLNIGDYANREIPKDETLAWDFIDSGVSQEFLAREDANADSATPVQDCRLSSCHACGAVDALARICGGNAICPPDYPDKGSVDAQPKISERPTEGAWALFTFEKTDRLRWLGHLDIMRVFERALRVSGISVAYSQGFNPRPRMSIASALPLGATAAEEPLLLMLADESGLESVVKRLNAALPRGLAVTSAQMMPANAKAPELKLSKWKVRVCIPAETGYNELEEVCKQIIAQESIIVQRKADRKLKDFDIRPGIQSLEAESDDGGVYIIMCLPHREFTVKPSEIIDVIGRFIPGVEAESYHRDGLAYSLGRKGPARS